MNRTLLSLALWSSLLVPSCDTGQGPSETAAGSIEYILSGGFGGGVRTRLTIDQGGHVTLHSSYPPLEDNLKPDEHLQLMSYFADIWRLPDTIPGGCIDDFGFSIRWTDNRGTKTVRIDGCALNPTNGSHPFPTLESIFQILNNLADRVHEQKSPWKGITVVFSIDKNSYRLDEPVRFSYLLKNPTAQDRSLFFRHADQFWFSVSKSIDPGFDYTYPSSSVHLEYSTDTSSPSSSVLRPGEEKELVYLWDHSFTRTGGTSGTLSPGYYHVRMGLLAGDPIVQDLSFDVYDPQIPVKGEIIPDWTGSDGSSGRYTFQLQVTNWTQSSITLHFRNHQRIAVELWDLNFSPPTSVIYRTPLSAVIDEQSRTIAPQDSVVFSETVVKADITPSYFWTLAKIKLLCTDFEFTAEGQLQIFR